MKTFAKIWDFIWGTLIVGMLPMFAFCLVVILGSFVRLEIDGGWIHKFLICFFFVACLVVPFATLFFICRWRMSHRLLPVAVLPVEIFLGLILSAAFFFFVFAIWGMALIN